MSLAEFVYYAVRHMTLLIHHTKTYVTVLCLGSQVTRLLILQEGKSPRRQDHDRRLRPEAMTCNLVCFRLPGADMLSIFPPKYSKYEDWCYPQSQKHVQEEK